MKIDEKHWGWIVPVILLIAVALGLFFGCLPNRAEASEPTPSPTPDVVGPTVGFNALALVVTVLIIALAAAVAYRNMGKHSND